MSYAPSPATRAIWSAQRFRGLLCGGCNTAAGGLRDSPDLCRALADYLARFA